MIPALSQVCSLSSPFEKDLEDYAAGHCRAIEVWLGKLETYLESHSLADVKQLLADYEMTMPVASYQGGLLATQGDARREHWSHFERRLGVCRELGIQVLVVACDVSGPLGPADFERVGHSLRQAAGQAEQAGVRLALEFQAQAAFGNNLQTAAYLIEETGSRSLGICFDVFHFYRGPSKTEDIAYLTTENLFHVQLSDLAGQPRELATDSDRILPGDGDFYLDPLIEHLRRINYQGLVSIELMNPNIWAVPARQFGEIGMTALRRLLGLASMG